MCKNFHKPPHYLPVGHFKNQFYLNVGGTEPGFLINNVSQGLHSFGIGLSEKSVVNKPISITAPIS
ncbi:hypothetical protein DMA11_10995 [Marinilabiliaceae bacterium JC017]|nr:hypothetical protein DMA11_10995 [Marinilabiliaceae bacterium JC017]